jgi:DNA-binding PadR family transcriptional regulator
LAECGEPREENEKTILRGYTRWESVLGNPAPIITADRIDIISHDNGNLSDETKVDKLLLYYSRKCPDKGSDIEFFSDLDYPITFSKNSVEFMYLLEKVAAESLGYVKMQSVTSGGPPEGYFQILPKGWERIIWLRKVKLADDKFAIEKHGIDSTIEKEEMQLKEEAAIKGTRWSSGLARKLNSLYLQGSIVKLGKGLRIYREVLYGAKTKLDAKELEYLGSCIANLAEKEKAFLNKTLSELYRDCHASESFFKTDIASVFSEIDRKLKSVLIDLETEGLSRESLKQPELPEKDIEELIKLEESSRLEFKSTFQWDIKLGRKNEELRKEVIKTAAAFNNTEGGYLIIGICDDKTIYGLEKDYGTFSHPNKKDRFLQTLSNVIADRISREFASKIKVKICSYMNKDVCRIIVNFGDGPIWVREEKGDEVFYVRTQNSEKRMSPSEAVSYIRNKWK